LIAMGEWMRPVDPELCDEAVAADALSLRIAR
jgi:hypothetical protein